MSSQKRKGNNSLSDQLLKHRQRYHTTTPPDKKMEENEIVSSSSSKGPVKDKDNNTNQCNVAKTGAASKSKPRMSQAEKQDRRQQHQLNKVIINNLSSNKVDDDNVKVPVIAKKVKNGKTSQEHSKQSLTSFEKLQRCVVDVTSKSSGQIKIISPSSSVEPFTHFTTTKVQVVTTCCDPTQWQRSLLMSNNVDNSITTVIIKPLLILDVNGIICHRIRKRRDTIILKPENEYYRPSIGTVAKTPVIPRPNLHEFLQFVSYHFSLAFWTSAKSKNATKLLTSLLPQDIQSQLVFVWAQHDCECTNPNSADPIFIKDLRKVWDRFPLWNNNNTLLVDDSPEKCTKWTNNAIHPAPMNGLQHSFFHNFNSRMSMKHIPDRNGTHYLGEHDNNNQDKYINLLLNTTRSDESNVHQQKEFFDKLVKHWTVNNIVQEWDSESDDGIFIQSSKSSTSQLHFLMNHAKGHMGWS